MSANGQLALGLRYSRRAAGQRLAALAVAALVTLVPVAEALCAINLPAADASGASISIDAPAGASSGEHRPGQCCDNSPSALAASDDGADALAPGSARTPDHSPAWAASLLHRSDRAVARTKIRSDIAPATQPLFRRLKRLLI
ncbi:MAG TPA: hypothetical protein VJM14_13395 [Burkholderiales bacterium]|nr:hypothetical protein [Burkholderiales bacterium]